MRSFEEIKDRMESADWRPESIGTQSEQAVHRAIKYWLSPDPTTHEVRLHGRIADVFVDGRVYEIQTRGFRTIAAKVEALLAFGPVTIVYPVVRRRTVYRVGPEGAIGPGRTSPRRGKPASLLAELDGIRELVGRPGLAFLILIFDAAEYRSADNAKRGKTSGRVDLYPRGTPDVLNVATDADFRRLATPAPTEPLTAAAFAKAVGLPADAGAAALRFLRFRGLAVPAGRSGRASLYGLVPVEDS